MAFQIHAMSLDEVLEALEKKQAEQGQYLPLLRRFISHAVPWITREQAAWMLNGSLEHVLNLIEGGQLVEHERKTESGRPIKSHARIKSADAWKLYLDGKTGRKQNITLNKIFGHA